MSTLKKPNKTKFMTENIKDFLNESQFIKDSPKGKKTTQKRQNVDADVDEEEDISKLIAQCQANMKKKKIDPSIDGCKESRQKLLNVMSQQLMSRKQGNDRLMKSLSEVLEQMEVDYNALKENEQKLEHLTGAFLKCIQQATNAHKQKLKSLRDIHTSFRKEVEGLITRGGMKPDERPLWFDVYKRFPPISEPKFAKPKPDNIPIRPILYQEDTLRAQFHSKGHGFGAVNMLSPQGETHTKKLIQAYKKLKAEGVSEDKLIEKSVSAVDSERKMEQTQPEYKMKPLNPASVTAQILAEANIKNIFSDKD